MNSHQIEFLIFILLPIVLSLVVDVVTFRSKKYLWTTWYEAIIPLYMIETIISVLVATFVMLGM